MYCIAISVNNIVASFHKNIFSIFYPIGYRRLKIQKFLLRMYSSERAVNAFNSFIQTSVYAELFLESHDSDKNILLFGGFEV